MIVKAVLHLLRDINTTVTLVLPTLGFQELVLERNEPTKHITCCVGNGTLIIFEKKSIGGTDR